MTATSGCVNGNAEEWLGEALSSPHLAKSVKKELAAKVTSLGGNGRRLLTCYTSADLQKDLCMALVKPAICNGLPTNAPCFDENGLLTVEASSMLMEAHRTIPSVKAGTWRMSVRACEWRRSRSSFVSETEETDMSGCVYGVEGCVNTIVSMCRTTRTL